MEECYQHYLECRAVNQFPDDPIVRRNAAAIRDVLDTIDKNDQLRFQQTLVTIAMSR